jgi:hypothetical protein
VQALRGGFAARQNSFDVRWIKSKSIAENLISPLAARLSANYDLSVKGKCLVQELRLADDGRVNELRYKVYSCHPPLSRSQPLFYPPELSVGPVR